MQITRRTIDPGACQWIIYQPERSGVFALSDAAIIILAYREGEGIEGESYSDGILFYHTQKIVDRSGPDTTAGLER